MSEFKTEWVKQYAPWASLMFDVGAYDGEDTLRFARELPGVRLVAFECDPWKYNAHTLAKLNLQGIAFVHAAATDVDGPVSFNANTEKHQAGPGASGSILPPTERLLKDHPHLIFHEPITVPGLRLDTYCQTEGLACPDVIHMDVQGAEWNVITGLGGMRPRMIYLETAEVTQGHYEGAKDAQALLRSMGYVLRWESSYDALYSL